MWATHGPFICLHALAFLQSVLYHAGYPKERKAHMSDPHAAVTVRVHSTPDAIFSALARVFPVTAHDDSRWLDVPSDGVTVTFYAERATPTDDAMAA